jgi:hypothetical protein
MAKYGFMPGTHEENRENPPVRSKFDKSQGRGLPAPHLGFPGKTVKVSGSPNGAGFTEHGHMLPHHRDAQNTDRVSREGVRKGDSVMHEHEPDPVRKDKGDRHERQHATGHGQESGKSSRPQHQDNHSSRKSGPHAELDRVKMKS